MKRSLPFIYLAVNIGCAVVVLTAAHHVGSVIAAERRDYSDGVDGITFFAASAPAFLLGLLANVAWAAKVFADLWRRRGYEAFAWLGAGAAVWVAAIVTARLF
jgi:hypothetical protein